MAERTTKTKSDARERLLDVAEQMFMEAGYRGVRLKDISGALGIKAASIYYHAPGGKEDLYIAVLERSLERHRKSLSEVLGGATGARGERLRAVANWLCSQPRMNITRIADELRWLQPQAQQRVRELSFASVLQPLRNIFVDGPERGNENLLASLFLSAVDTVRSGAEAELLSTSQEEAINQAISLFERA